MSEMVVLPLSKDELEKIVTDAVRNATPAVVKQFYSIQEASEILGISLSSTYRYVSNGSIESVDVGNKKVIPQTYFDRLASK